MKGGRGEGTRMALRTEKHKDLNEAKRESRGKEEGHALIGGVAGG